MRYMEEVYRLQKFKFFYMVAFIMVALGFAMASILLRYPFWFSLPFFIAVISILLLLSFVPAVNIGIVNDKGFGRHVISGSIANLLFNVGWGTIEIAYKIPLGSLLYEKGHMCMPVPSLLIKAAVVFQWLFPCLLLLTLVTWAGGFIIKSRVSHEPPAAS